MMVESAQLTPASVPISILRVGARRPATSSVGPPALRQFRWGVIDPTEASCPEGAAMFEPPIMGKFEFARLSSLRAAQLMRGCTARVPGHHKRTTTAQREVAAGKVVGLPR